MIGYIVPSEIYIIRQSFYEKQSISDGVPSGMLEIWRYQFH